MLYYFYNELLNKYMYEAMDLFRQERKYSET